MICYRCKKRYLNDSNEWGFCKPCKPLIIPEAKERNRKRMEPLKKARKQQLMNELAERANKLLEKYGKDKGE